MRDLSRKSSGPSTVEHQLTYSLIGDERRELERLLLTRGAYKRTQRRLARSVAIASLIVFLATGLAPSRSVAGTPSFAAPVTNPFGISEETDRPTIELVDIDGDGDLDAFIGLAYGAKYVNAVSIFQENVGTAAVPSFAAPSGTFGLPAAGGFVALTNFTFRHTMADIDGDGDYDAFLSPFGGVYGMGFADNDLGFAENTGSAIAPAFATVVTSSPLGLTSPDIVGSLTLGDLDGDGDLDAITGSRGTTSSDFILQENEGTATTPAFGSGSAFLPFAGSTYTTPTLVDIDSDGDLDLFYGDGVSTGLWFSENTGTPTMPSMAAAIANPFGLTALPGALNTSISFADIDADGDDDAFVGSNLGITYFENLEVDCGDATVNGFEVCDGSDLAGETCETLGYDGGTLACAADCGDFDATGCFGLPCDAAPPTECLFGAKASFQIKDKAGDTKDQLKWNLKKAEAFDQADLGDPLSSTDYALCVYDETASAPSLVFRAGIPGPNGTWIDKSPKGLQLKDKSGFPAGITKVTLKTGADGKTKAQIKANGANLTLPGPQGPPPAYFAQDPNVTVVLINSEGTCWTSEFDASGTKKNNVEQFKAKAQ